MSLFRTVRRVNSSQALGSDSIRNALHPSPVYPASLIPRHGSKKLLKNMRGLVPIRQDHLIDEIPTNLGNGSLEEH
jgi:hypothetical protein